MIIITTEQTKILRNYIENIDTLLKGSLEDLLDVLDSAMLDSMNGNNFEIETEDSIKLAKIYDQIVYQNQNNEL